MRREAAGALALGVLLASSACRQEAPEVAPSAAATTPARAPSGALPSSRGAEGLEPSVRDGIAQAIAAARPLLERGNLSEDDLDIASRPCLLEHAHQLMAEAADCYARVERVAPRDGRWPYLLGHAELGLDDRQAALAAFERALEDEPGDAPILAWLGQVLFDLGRFDEARARLEQAIKADPSNAVALFRLGQLELQEGHAAEAVGRFRAVLALQPGATAAHHALAQALSAAGRDGEAEQHARLAGQVRPGMRDPWLDAVKASASGERMHVERGGRALVRGDLVKAEAEFRLAIQDDPKSLDAWLNLGAILTRRGDTLAAREALERALALAPEDPDVHFNLGVVAAAEGKTSEAASHQRDALRLDPAHARASYNLGSALLRLGQPEEAAALFHAVLERDAANVDARLAEARCLVDLGRDAQAAASLEQGLLAAPGHPGLSAALARLLATSRADGLRDGARALELAKAAIAVERTLETVETLAMAHAEIGEFAEAVKWQETALDAARRANRPDLLGRIEGTLALYRKNQPLRLP